MQQEFVDRLVSQCDKEQEHMNKDVYKVSVILFTGGFVWVSRVSFVAEEGRRYHGSEVQVHAQL